MTDQLAELQDQLHKLEAHMEALRRRIWAIENGLELVENPEPILGQLRAEFDGVARAFTETYREWTRGHAEE